MIYIIFETKVQAGGRCARRRVSKANRRTAAALRPEIERPPYKARGTPGQPGDELRGGGCGGVKTPPYKMRETPGRPRTANGWHRLRAATVSALFYEIVWRLESLTIVEIASAWLGIKMAKKYLLDFFKKESPVVGSVLRGAITCPPCKHCCGKLKDPLQKISLSGTETVRRRISLRRSFPFAG